MKIPPIKMLVRLAEIVAESHENATATALSVEEAQALLNEVERNQANNILARQEKLLRELTGYMTPTQLEAYRELVKQAASVCAFRSSLMHEAQENNSKTLGHLRLSNGSTETLLDTAKSIVVDHAALMHTRSRAFALIGGSEN